MVKLNLNALNNNAVNNNQFFEEPITSQLGDNLINSQDNTSENSTEVKTKKISLKKLTGISKVDNIEVLGTDNIQAPLQENNQSQFETITPKKNKISLKKDIPQVDNTNTLINDSYINNENNNTKEIIEKSDTDTTDEIKKDFQITESPQQEAKTINISDGDTKCVIVNNIEEEIFSSYQGSFGISIEENSTPLQNEETQKEIKVEQIITNQENIKTLIEEKNISKEENNNIDTISPQSTETATDEKSKSLNTSIKLKKIKLIAGGVFSSICIGLSILLIGQTGLMKGNIQEIPTENKSNILNNNQIIEKKETKNTNPLSNKINENNTISDTKTEIVKENSQQLVENINNSSKINKKVENFLIKKYKK